MERKQEMKLKLLISTGLVIGLLAISVTAFAGSFADELQISPREISREIRVEATEAPDEQLTVTPAGEPLTETPTPEPTEEPVESLVYSRDWDADDAYLLAKIAMAEAENQDTEGKALVICVVLNRVWSSGFPDTIREVIYQKNQFSPVGNGRIDRVEPNQDCWEALRMVEMGWDKSQGALYFESESASTWHRNHLKFLFQHEDHMFYTNKE